MLHNDGIRACLFFAQTGVCLPGCGIGNRTGKRRPYSWRIGIWCREYVHTGKSSLGQSNSLFEYEHPLTTPCSCKRLPMMPRHSPKAPPSNEAFRRWRTKKSSLCQAPGRTGIFLTTIRPRSKSPFDLEGWTVIINRERRVGAHGEETTMITDAEILEL